MTRKQRHRISKADITVFSEFGGLPIQDQILLERVNSDDEHSVKTAIRQYMPPILNGWESQDPGSSMRAKMALWYYIHHQPWPPEKVFGRGEHIMPEPDDPLKYYRWAWEELYGDVETEMPDPTEANFEVVER
jgi:hypothetical protein